MPTQILNEIDVGGLLAENGLQDCAVIIRAMGKIPATDLASYLSTQVELGWSQWKAEHKIEAYRTWAGVSHFSCLTAFDKAAVFCGMALYQAERKDAARIFDLLKKMKDIAKEMENEDWLITRDIFEQTFEKIISEFNTEAKREVLPDICREISQFYLVQVDMEKTLLFQSLAEDMSSDSPHDMNGSQRREIKANNLTIIFKE